MGCRKSATHVCGLVARRGIPAWLTTVGQGTHVSRIKTGPPNQFSHFFSTTFFLPNFSSISLFFALIQNHLILLYKLIPMAYALL